MTAQILLSVKKSMQNQDLGNNTDTIFTTTIANHLYNKKALGLGTPGLFELSP